MRWYWVAVVGIAACSRPNTTPKVHDRAETEYLWDDAECMAILKAEPPSLRPHGLACPVDENVPGFRVDCPTHPSTELACGEVPLRAQFRKSGKANGAGFLLPQILTSGIAGHSCRDLFVGTELERALAQVKADPDDVLERAFAWKHSEKLPLASDDFQRAMATVLAHTGDLVLCDTKRDDEKTGGKVHGQNFHTTGELVVYLTACDARSIERAPLKFRSPAVKLFLVFGHELGHSIDVESGDYGKTEAGMCADRELRASLYGTYIAECYARVFAGLADIGAAGNLNHSDAGRGCLSRYYLDAAEKLKALRLDLQHGDGSTRSNAQKLVGCASGPGDE